VERPRVEPTTSRIASQRLLTVKAAFHDADTDTDLPDTPTSLRPTRATSSRGCRYQCQRRCRGMRQPLSWNSTRPTRTPTPTRTSSSTFPRGSSRGCPATSPFSLPRAGHARRSSPTCPPTCPTRGALFLARILERMSVRDARVYTCKRVLYTISYHKITR